MVWIEWDQECGLVAANQLDSAMTGDEIMGGDDEWPFGFDGGCSTRFDLRRIMSVAFMAANQWIQKQRAMGWSG